MLSKAKKTVANTTVELNIHSICNKGKNVRFLMSSVEADRFEMNNFSLKHLFCTLKKTIV